MGGQQLGQAQQHINTIHSVKLSPRPNRNGPEVNTTPVVTSPAKSKMLLELIVEARSANFILNHQQLLRVYAEAKVDYTTEYLCSRNILWQNEVLACNLAVLADSSSALRVCEY